MNLSSYVEQRNMNSVQKDPVMTDVPKDADFKSFVLYVNRDPFSQEIIDLLNEKPNIKKRTMIYQVQQLDKKPSFLTTVPMLIDKEERKAYTNEKIIETLKKHKDFPMSVRDRKRTNAWLK